MYIGVEIKRKKEKKIGFDRGIINAFNVIMLLSSLMLLLVYVCAYFYDVAKR